MTQGITLRNAYDRAEQFRAAAEPNRVLAFARRIVAAKGANQRTLLGRNSKPRPEAVLTEMATMLRKVEHASSPEQLLGIEGSIAAKYSENFGTLCPPARLHALEGGLHAERYGTQGLHPRV